jgi:hypothetical protein
VSRRSIIARSASSTSVVVTYCRSAPRTFGGLDHPSKLAKLLDGFGKASTCSSAAATT